jgi:uncharacterized membrane protein YcaP (DUF421 family)
MGMEPEIKDFLLRIVNTISMGLVFLLVNMSIGIYYGFAFFEEKPSLGNYIFYVWFIISLVLIIKYLKKKWKGWKEIGEE